MLRPSSHPCTDVGYLQNCELTLQGDCCMLGLLLQQSSCCTGVGSQLQPAGWLLVQDSLSSKDLWLHRIFIYIARQQTSGGNSA